MSKIVVVDVADCELVDGLWQFREHAAFAQRTKGMAAKSCIDSRVDPGQTRKAPMVPAAQLTAPCHKTITLHVVAYIPYYGWLTHHHQSEALSLLADAMHGIRIRTLHESSLSL